MLRSVYIQYTEKMEAGRVWVGQTGHIFRVRGRVPTMAAITAIHHPSEFLERIVVKMGEHGAGFGP